MTKQSVSDDDIDLELVSESESSKRVKQVVLASVLASLSIAAAPIAEVVPRIPGWGIAVFDPVSIFWIVAFLLGGLWVGLVSVIAGTMGLFLYDPTAVGPIFKLVATLPMIVIPWLSVRRTKKAVRGETLSHPKYYITLMIIAFIVRLGLMIPINLAYGAIAYPFFTMEFITTYALILNTFQSIWDALIPFIIVYPTGVYKTFKMW
ncbi:MAG: hypothetical protein RTU63_10530 [Candidatus Thorarchaeota archaeon]